MAQTLDYEPSIHRPPPRALALFANLTTAYPLLLLASLYGQWLLSWRVLGHHPQPSLDDPTSIDGASWMTPVTALALAGFVPAGCGAVALNTLYAVSHRLRGFRLVTRIAVAAALWVGTFVLLRWDPGLVVYWWFD